MLCEVPAPAWYTSTTNWSRKAPDRTSSAALTIAAATSGSSRPTAALAAAAAFFTSTVALTNSGESRQSADREVLERSRGLDAVVGVGRHLALAQRIPLCSIHVELAERRNSELRFGFGVRNAELPKNYTARMLPSFFSSVLELIVKTSTDLPPDVRVAMRQAMTLSRRAHGRRRR